MLFQLHLSVLVAIIFYTGNVACQLVWVETLERFLSQQGIAETTTPGTVLGELQARGANGPIYYSSNSSVIVVFQTSGRVLLQSQLVYADTPSFIIRFAAIDSTNSSNQIFVDVVVRVLSTNNREPVLDLASYSVTALECDPVGRVIYNQIEAKDDDAGLAGTLSATCYQPIGDTEAQAACNTFSISIVNVGGGSNRISIQLASILDYSVKNSYSMTIQVTDGGNPRLSASTKVSIAVRSRLDLTPIFGNTPISLLVQDSQSNETVLSRIQASIPCDQDNNTGLIFRITRDPANWFYMDSTTFNSVGFYEGNIRSNGRISRNTVLFTYGGIYQFDISAIATRNNIDTGVSVTTTVNVNPSSTVNSPPLFNLPTYSATVLTGINAGSFVSGLNMIISDPDIGDAGFFELTAVSNPRPVDGIFGLVPSQGQGSVAVSMTVLQPSFLTSSTPTYTVTVTAVNSRTQARLNGSTVVTISVRQANILPPFFSQSAYAITIYDNYALGALTNQISAVDYNTGATKVLMYSILSGDTSYVTVDPTTCVVTLIRPLNYALVKSLQYVLKATNGGGVFTTATLTITILNSALNNLKFSDPQYNTAVVESTTTMTPPVVIFVSNLIADRNPSYVIVNYNGAPPGLFVLDTVGIGSAARAYLNMTRGVDYDETPNRMGVFELTVMANDNDFNSPLTNNVTVLINIRDTNNRVPTFDNATYQATLFDDSLPGTYVITVRATDLDVGLNARVNYKILTGGRDKFVVDPDDGIITVAPGANLDLDTNPREYNLTVLAVDGGSPPNTGSATVYVTIMPSQRPVFDTGNYVFYVQDSVPLSTLVGSVMASVKRSTATIRYAVVPRSISARDRYGNPVTNKTSLFDYETMFSVNATTGSVFVFSQLNWNYAAVVIFQVLAANTKDVNTLQTTATVTIYISRSTIQFYPPLDPNNQKVVVAISEQRPIGFVVPYQVLAYSNNPLSVFNYSLAPASDASKSLSLDPKSGLITVAKIIQYESLPAPKELTLFAVARDLTVANSSATVTIIVQIVKVVVPTFNQSSYSYTLYTNAPVGSSVGTIEAVDSVTGLPSVFTYQITDATSYAINASTGVLSVASSLDTPNKQAPYTDSFPVLATAVNSLGVLNSASVPVTVTVLNVTMSGPTFIGEPYNFQVSGSTRNNTPFGLVTAVDFTSGRMFTGLYSIVPGRDSSLFSINNVSGVIQVNQDMTNYVRPQPYVLNISATAGSPERVSYTLVYITVTNNTLTDGLLFIEQPPNDGFVFTVPEGQTNVINVTTVVASTTRPNVTIQYFFFVNNTVTNTTGNFSIDPNTGLVTVHGASLDWTVQRSYILTLLVRDSGRPPRQTIRPIVIRIPPPNRPTFQSCPGYQNPIVVHVKKDARVGYRVANISACNTDATAPIYYYLFSGNSTNALPTTPFLPDSFGTSGAIFVNGPLDIYTTPIHFLTMAAYNASSASLTTLQNASLIAVHVVVDDVDVNGPTFDNSIVPSPNCAGIGKQVNRAVRDFPAAGGTIVKMYAGDCDKDPENRRHNYSLSGISFAYTSTGSSYSLKSDDQNNVAKAFTIDVLTGNVISNLLNYRPYSFGRFQATVTATDSQGRSDSSTLTIYTITENDILKYTYSLSPKQVAPQSGAILGNLARQSKQPESVNVTGLDSHYHIVNDPHILDKFGYEEWLDRPYIKRSLSDLCFYMVNGAQVLNVDNYQTAFIEQLSALPIQNDTYNQLKPDRCYPHLTTHWWSGNFWVWWWLIALALLIFLIALILVIVLSFYACSAEKKYESSKPYVWLDGPVTNAASEFEFTDGQ